MKYKKYNDLPIIAPIFLKTKKTKESKETKALKKVIEELSDTINLQNNFWAKERLKFTLFIATALLKEKIKNDINRKKTSN